MPAGSSSDDAAAPSAVSLNGGSFLLFKSVLDGQSMSNQGTDEVGEADASLDVLETTIPARQAAIDSLATLLTASFSGTRPLPRKDDINKSAAITGPNKDNQRNVEPHTVFA